MVVNLDPARDEGSHWVAIYVQNSTTVLYWDSYALPVLEPIKEFLEEFKQVKYNTYPYQKLSTQVCGQYCIFFLYTISEPNFPYVTKTLNRNVPNTDPFVSKFVKALIY